MLLFLLFIIIPVVEISLFIQVGGAIGVGWTLILIIITAFLGAWLVRNQGLSALVNVKSAFSNFSDPTEPLAHGLMILFSGALLLTPGFFTDAIGFSLLMPPVRTWLFRFLKNRANIQVYENKPKKSQPQSDYSSSQVIDGEWEEIEPEHASKPDASGWTKR